MGLPSFLGSQTGSYRLASHHRPKRSKQALKDPSNKDGDPSSFAPYCKTKRPLGKLRPEGRFLRPLYRSKGPRDLQIKHRRKPPLTMRPPHRMVTKPVHISKTDKSVYNLLEGPREDINLSGWIALYVVQRQKEAVTTTTAPK